MQDVVEEVVSDLAASGGASMIGYTPAGTGAVATTVQSKLLEKVNVTDFGAVVGGVTDTTAAFLAMASSEGKIIVPYGDFKLSTCYIDVPIFFELGAAITINAGQNVTIRNRISSSPKQQIFKGAGNVYFEINGQFGEDSKHSYAAWWGIFPIGDQNIIQTAAFNKALSAYTTQTREGIFELDIGSYRIDGTVIIPRGVHLKGAGTRRTIFDLVGSGFTALQSGGSAVKITGIQFEQPSGQVAFFNGTQINLLHDTPTVEDVRLWNANVGIRVGINASAARITQVDSVYGAEPVGGYGDGSCLVWCQGDRATIYDVRAVGTSHGPKSLILVGSGNTSSITNVTISDIHTTEKTVPVSLVADVGGITNITINNVLFFGDTGNNIQGVIEISTAGTASIQGVSIGNVVSNSIAASLLKVTQSSSGITQAISFSSGTAYSPQTKAADLTRTAGTLTRIAIGDAVEASQAVNPVTRSGSMSRITVPDHMWPLLTLANDTVGQIVPLEIGGQITLINMGNGGDFPNVNSSGVILYDVGVTPASLKISGGANLATLTANTVPTGTTGTVGNISVSPVDTRIMYVENRTGDSVSIRYSFA